MKRLPLPASENRKQTLCNANHLFFNSLGQKIDGRVERKKSVEFNRIHRVVTNAN